MKKIIGILLVIMLLLTACGSNGANETEEGNKVNEVDEVTKATESSKVSESELDENTYILEGILISNEPPLGTGIKLNEPIEITRKWNDETYTYEYVYFSGNEIYNYVDREEFIYEDPFILLKNDSDIPVKIKFNFSGFIESEGIIEDGHIWTDIYEILEVNGSSNLVDKSDEPYPFSEEQNVIYDPADIKIGQDIGGLKVTQNDYKKGQEIILELKGNVSVEGVVTGYYNSMYEENEFSFKSKNENFDKPIECTFNSGFKNSINKFEGICNIEEFLDDETENYVLEGNELSVNVTIESFGICYRDETEGGTFVSILNCEIIE